MFRRALCLDYSFTLRHGFCRFVDHIGSDFFRFPPQVLERFGLILSHKACCISSSQRCSVGFSFGDWERHDMRWILLSLNHSFTAFEECLFWMLFFWEIHMRVWEVLSSVYGMEKNRRITFHSSLHIWIGPVQCSLKHPQTMTYPPHV